MLQAKALSKSFGDKSALRSLDLQVEAAEIFCLLGANGAGKTTTINLFLGFTKPTSGGAFVDGIEVATDPSAARRRLAYIPEQVSLYGSLSGLENLDYFTSLAGRSSPIAELRELLRTSGLAEDPIDRPVETYSKGMRQKVAIAIARARHAKALLLDEPTSGLDPEASNEFSQLLIAMRENQVAVLMATHDLFRAREIATRIGIMRQGELLTTIEAASVGHRQLEELYLDLMRR